MCHVQYNVPYVALQHITGIIVSWFFIPEQMYMHIANFHYTKHHNTNKVLNISIINTIIL